MNTHMLQVLLYPLYQHDAKRKEKDKLSAILLLCCTYAPTELCLPTHALANAVNVYLPPWLCGGDI